jgi:hypothetical protein
MDIYRKSFTGIEFKKDKPGSFTARIATLNVIDKDGDVTLNGAFPEGKEILISAYQHTSWEGALPVGKGVVHESGNDVLVEGEFNLNTESGKEHYEAIKFAPQLTEWSYGFKILATDDENTTWKDNPKVWRILKSVDIFEASPVLRGAGVNTATLAIKSDNPTSYSDQAEAVLAAVNDLVLRSESLADLRRKEGRELSAANKERLTTLQKSLADLSGNIKTLLETPEPKTDKAQIQKLFLESVEIRSKIFV